MKEFVPTYLYIKQHLITKKLYFGKTIRSEKHLLEQYNGGGRYWTRHIKKHGKEYVETIWYCLFTDKEELVKFALMCSEQWGIVKSKDWANEKFENGLDGGNEKGHNKGKKQKTEHILNRTIAIKKSHNMMSIEERKSKFGQLVGNKNPMYGLCSESRAKNIGLANKGKTKGIKRGPQSKEHKLNLSMAKKGILKIKTVSRLIDRKEMAMPNFINWCNYQDKKNANL